MVVCPSLNDFFVVQLNVPATYKTNQFDYLCLAECPELINFLLQKLIKLAVWVFQLFPEIVWEAVRIKSQIIHRVENLLGLLIVFDHLRHRWVKQIKGFLTMKVLHSLELHLVLDLLGRGTSRVRTESTDNSMYCSKKHKFYMSLPKIETSRTSSTNLKSSRTITKTELSTPRKKLKTVASDR